jgi:hypothetical protein
MTDIRVAQTIKVTVENARGASVTEMARRSGAFGVQPADGDAVALEKLADAVILENPNFKGDIGDPGPAGNVAATLDQLKAAPITNGTMIAAYDDSGSTMTWREGDYTSQAAERPQDFVKSNDYALTAGAWVRQDAATVPYRPVAPGVITRPTAERLADSIRVHDHGAYGDTNPHPLSERFDSLAAARAAYPGVPIVALTDRSDGVAMQAAIRRAARLALPGFEGGYETRAIVLMRAGRYLPTRTLRLPNSVKLMGAGGGATIIDAQNFTVDGPLIVNDTPGSVDMQLEGFSIHGGTHAVKIDSGSNGQVNSLSFRDVQMRLQTDKCFEANRLLQLAYFDRCVFSGAPYGFYAPGWTTNAVTLLNCGFEDISWIPLTLRSAEAVNIIGGRFEAGGNSAIAKLTGRINGTTLTVENAYEGMIRPGGLLIADGSGLGPAPGTSIRRQINGTPGGNGTYEVSVAQTLASRPLFNVGCTIDLDQATVNDAGCQVTLRGTYIENTAPYLVRDRASRDGVSFDGCHFTQALDKDGFPTDYVCDSDGVIHFGSNDQSVKSVILPDNALVTGQNAKLFGNTNLYTSRAPGSTRFRSRRVEATGEATIPALTMTRIGSTGASMTAGVLTVGLLGFDNASGAVIRFSQRFRLIVYPNAGTLYMEKVSEVATGTPLTATVDIQAGPGASATYTRIDIVVSGLNGSTPSSVWWSFEEDGVSMTASEYLRVKCA